MKGIHLVENTIDNKDIDSLIEWLKTYPKLTKGKLTVEFENKWSEWLGCKYSVYVNSGSSANLAMIYAMKCSGRLRSNKIIVPAVSWSTTVAPLIQFGFEPIFCDCDRDTLGLDVEHLKKLLLDNTIQASAVLMVHALGVPCKVKEIQELCLKEGIPLLEDSCESIGSMYGGITTGNFGVMSTFSYYFGHHMSTIEGGMVCTNDKELYDILLMLRSHGWDRDLDKDKQAELRKKHNVSEFKSVYTFYYPAFNIRATDLQAHIGIQQLKKLDDMCDKRIINFFEYHRLIKNDYWKLPYVIAYQRICNFAYPIIHPKRDEISKALTDNNIENRPLICGSMEYQPFCEDIIGDVNLDLGFADIVELYGMYVPNHPEMTLKDIQSICKIVNEVINE